MAQFLVIAVTNRNPGYAHYEVMPELTFFLLFADKPMPAFTQFSKRAVALTR
ncbi:MAG TPA: hypothetical protein VMU07_04275 [Candidatus Paceibacterota bacterium]|nr:hypothetical protein [Candidatus Paceibacterota bacterium]